MMPFNSLNPLNSSLGSTFSGANLSEVKKQETDAFSSASFKQQETIESIQAPHNPSFALMTQAKIESIKAKGLEKPQINNTNPIERRFVFIPAESKMKYALQNNEDSEDKIFILETFLIDPNDFQSQQDWNLEKLQRVFRNCQPFLEKLNTIDRDEDLLEGASLAFVDVDENNKAVLTGNDELGQFFASRKIERLKITGFDREETLVTNFHFETANLVEAQSLSRAFNQLASAIVIVRRNRQSQQRMKEENLHSIKHQSMSPFKKPFAPIKKTVNPSAKSNKLFSSLGKVAGSNQSYWQKKMKIEKANDQKRKEQDNQRHVSERARQKERLYFKRDRLRFKYKSNEIEKQKTQEQL